MNKVDNVAVHMGRSVFGRAAQGTECHQILVEQWAEMEAARGTLFVSIPSLLDENVSPAGTHLMHVFTPDWVDDWKVRMPRSPKQLSMPPVGPTGAVPRDANCAYYLEPNPAGGFYCLVSLYQRREGPPEARGPSDSQTASTPQ
jgi:hypothetical protein